MKRGQVAVEYLAMFSIMFFALSVLVVLVFDSTSTQSSVSQGEIAVSSIDSAAKSVYSQGVGSRQTITVNIPERVDLDNSEIRGRFIHLRIITADGYHHDVVSLMPFNVTGSFPDSAGRKRMVIEALVSGNVSITEVA